MTLDLSTFDLNTLTGEVVDMMRARAREKDLGLAFDLQLMGIRHLHADPVKLRQILINLLSNAIKFTSRGRVLLRLRHHRDASGDLRLDIEVQDTGMGLHPEDIERVFQPFVQAGAPSGEGGTGLGLTITRQFVELMGGTISVRSAPGQGTTFRVIIPVMQATAPDAPQAAHRADHATGPAPEREPPPAGIAPERLAPLPIWLRQALHEALISLDAERIASAIDRMTQYDPPLGQLLTQHARRYHYTPILAALEPSLKDPSQ